MPPLPASSSATCSASLAPTACAISAVPCDSITTTAFPMHPQLTGSSFLVNEYKAAPSAPFQFILVSQAGCRQGQSRGETHHVHAGQGSRGRPWVWITIQHRHRKCNNPSLAAERCAVQLQPKASQRHIHQPADVSSTRKKGATRHGVHVSCCCSEASLHLSNLVRTMATSQHRRLSLCNLCHRPRPSAFPPSGRPSTSAGPGSPTPCCLPAFQPPSRQAACMAHVLCSSFNGLSSGG